MSQPTNGTSSNNGNNVTYTPDPDFWGKGELLGEVLEALGLIKEETLHSALQMQVSEN